MKKILVVLGTRPEAIKLSPVILTLKEMGCFEVSVCNTEQQKELSNQTLAFFGISADINLNIMSPNQSLAMLQSRLLAELEKIFRTTKYDGVVVQGDTMSVFCGALMAFYHKVPIFHVEAGLRSFDLFEPFPEEAIRQMVSRITDLHFVPTKDSKSYLLSEHIESARISYTGNTVIDALSRISEDSMQNAKTALFEKGVSCDEKLVLVTAHRRENHGNRLDSIIKAVAKLAEKYKDHQFLIPVHPNPNVKEKVIDGLSGYKNIILTEPLDYPELVMVLSFAKLILTDSGGIQEEAPSFGVPILVMRYETERMEGVRAGFAKLVGADEEAIVREAALVLDNPKSETRILNNENPYGDGKASYRIGLKIKEFLGV